MPWCHAAAPVPMENRDPVQGECEMHPLRRMMAACLLLTLVAAPVWLAPAAAQSAFTGGEEPAAKEAADTAAEDRGRRSFGGDPAEPMSAAVAAHQARQGGSVDADTLLAEVAHRYRQAVGVVVASIPGRGPIPVGTAWAFEPALFATNGHVHAQMLKYGKEYPGTAFFVALNGSDKLRLRVRGASVHPDYGKHQVRFDGAVADAGYDVAVLQTAAPAPAHFELADRDELQTLRAGSRIAYLGFPMERLQRGNIDVNMPIATMQSGIVTSVSDYFMSDSGFENNRLIRHNLAATGGASGSPIFAPNGKVVAILWGVNMMASLDVNTEGDVALTRQANAALINFAERIDSLGGVPRP